MTRRERLERKVDRRDEWADKATQRSAAAFSAADRIAQAIPFGQPILVGHHSERHHRRDVARIEGGMRRGCEEQAKAQHHTEKAAGLAHQLATSIYSDDEDAVERLREKLAGLEAERDRIKAYNKSCRVAAKGGQPFGDLTLLDEGQRKDLLTTARVCPYQIGKGGSLPAYVLTNLGGNISRAKERLVDIERRAQRQAAAEEAGGVVIQRTGDDYCSVTFAEKPERSILDSLRAAGFFWSGGRWNGHSDSLPAEVLALAGESG